MMYYVRYPYSCPHQQSCDDVLRYPYSGPHRQSCDDVLRYPHSDRIGSHVMTYANRCAGPHRKFM